MIRRFLFEYKLHNIGFSTVTDEFVREGALFSLLFEGKGGRLLLSFRSDCGQFVGWTTSELSCEDQEMILKAVMETVLEPVLKRLALFGLTEACREENDGVIFIAFNEGPKLAFDSHTGIFLWVEKDTLEFPLNDLLLMAE